MKKHLVLVLFAALSLQTFAQIEYGGTPYLYSFNTVADIPTVSMPAIDIDRYRAEDDQLDQYKDIPYRFGANVEADIDLNNSGVWTTLDNGDRIWQVAISSPGAMSLNFVFDQYEVPEGGKIFVYDSAGKQVHGSYTSMNTSAIGSLGVGLLHGDKIVIEYQEPAGVAGQGYLHIGNVTHGYRTVMGIVNEAKAGPFGNSGPCNINVSCPEGDPYEVQSSSVAVIVVNNNGICSGALVNNTSSDGTPYFLTANHCLPFNQQNTNNWIFYFNHESPTCVGSTGPTNQSLTGGSVVASNQNSDFALLLLQNAPPESYDVCFAGWDATDNEAAVTSAIGIHHPGGDVKKICFENDAPYHNDVNTFLVNQKWWVDQWELGVTEGGSSGSPLYNQNGLIIGQLAGGLAACNGTVNNGLHDFYGRFGVSWDFGGSASSRLRDHLDAANTGLLVVNPLCPGQLPENNISISNITGASGVRCDTEPVAVGLTVVNTGTANVNAFQLSYASNGGAAQTFNWTGNLPTFNSITVELGTVNPSAGTNTIDVTVVSVNGGPDEEALGNNVSSTYTAFESPVDITVSIIFDDWPEETFWQIAGEDGNVIHSGGPYGEGAVSFQETFCLAPLTCYEFTIFDEFEDGICCGHGFGSYTVTDQFGNTIASGGEFEDEETTAFCTETASIAENPALQTIRIYPNPANDRALLDLGEVSHVNNITIFDAVGRQVWQSGERHTSGAQVDIATGRLGVGMYLVHISTDQGMAVRKLLIQR